MSANDISREIAGTAKEVHLACRTVNEHQTMGKQAVYNNMWCHPMVRLLARAEKLHVWLEEIDLELALK